MKFLRFLVLTGLVVVPHLVVAQSNPVPNAGFENWTSGNPVSWLTTNIPGIVTVTQVSSAHSGSSAVQGSVAIFNTVPFAPILQNFFPVDASYGTFTGWFTFSPVGGDSLIISLLVWHQGSPIGAGSFETGVSVASFTQFSFPIDYFLPGQADSAWILISIESSGDVHAGSTFVIDDLAMTNPTGVATDGGAPAVYALGQNYPNPFNPTTTIAVDVPARSTVRLTVLNVLGQRVAEIANTEVGPGRTLIGWEATVPSGVYFYRLDAQSISEPSRTFSQVRRMVVLK